MLKIILFNFFLLPIFLFGQMKEIDIVKDFNADPSGKTNSHIAFVNACNFIEKNNGNIKLTIPFGTYKVGKQIHLKGKKSSNGYPLNFEGIPIFKLHNLNNVQINGIANKNFNPKIIYESGLRYGTFSLDGSLPKSNDDFNIHPIGKFDSLISHCAEIGNCFDIYNCNNIKISNVEIDGNIQESLFGGHWSDIEKNTFPKNQRQIALGHSGIYIINSRKITIDNFIIKNFGLDGLYINNNLKDTTNQKIYLTNIKSSNNFRQGLSWVGGNGINVFNSEFSYTAKQNIKNGMVLSSPPMYGIDIEPSVGASCENGYFYKVNIFNNLGGNTVISGDKTAFSKNIKFEQCVFKVNTKTVNFVSVFLFGSVINIKFNKCFFYGSVDCEYNNRKGFDIEPVAQNSIDFTNSVFSDLYFVNKKENESNIYYKGLFFSNNFYFLKVNNCIFISKYSGLLHLKSTNSDFNATNQPIFNKNKFYSYSNSDSIGGNWLGNKTEKMLIINAIISQNKFYYSTKKQGFTLISNIFEKQNENIFTKMSTQQGNNILLTQTPILSK